MLVPRKKLHARGPEISRLAWGVWRALKGILSPDDAVLAKKTGADGVIVSNHGGRQLDGAVSALRVLASIVRETGDMPVMMDGGVRRGSDVIKALALGARCVFVGRPFNYAAPVGGEGGVLHAIDLLRSEIDRNLAMLELDRISAIDRSILRHVAAEPAP